MPANEPTTPKRRSSFFEKLKQLLNTTTKEEENSQHNPGPPLTGVLKRSQTSEERLLYSNSKSIELNKEVEYKAYTKGEPAEKQLDRGTGKLPGDMHKKKPKGH